MYCQDILKLNMIHLLNISGMLLFLHDVTLFLLWSSTQQITDGMLIIRRPVSGQCMYMQKILRITLLTWKGHDVIIKNEKNRFITMLTDLMYVCVIGVIVYRGKVWSHVCVSVCLWLDGWFGVGMDAFNLVGEPEGERYMLPNHKNNFERK